MVGDRVQHPGHRRLRRRLRGQQHAVEPGLRQRADVDDHRAADARERALPRPRAPSPARRRRPAAHWPRSSWRRSWSGTAPAARRAARRAGRGRCGRGSRDRCVRQPCRRILVCAVGRGRRARMRGRARSARQRRRGRRRGGTGAMFRAGRRLSVGGRAAVSGPSGERSPYMSARHGCTPVSPSSSTPVPRSRDAPEPVPQLPRLRAMRAGACPPISTTSTARPTMKPPTRATPPPSRMRPGAQRAARRGRRGPVRDRDGPEAGAAGLLLAHGPCSACSITMASAPWPPPPAGTAPCSAFRRWAPSAWRKRAGSVAAPRSTSSISTRTGA